MLKTILFKISFFILFLLWSPIMLVALVSRRLTRFFSVLIAAQCLFLARVIAGIKYEIHYPATEENGIPMAPNGNIRTDGKSIIAAKHMSALEVIILTYNIKNFTFIVKRELIFLPIYGWVFWRLGLIPVNRSRGKTDMRKLTNVVTNKVMNGYKLIIFPEGTRTAPGARPQLKRGLLFLASELKLPITPVGTDTGLYWPKHGKMKSGTANIYFEPTLPASATLEEIAEAINRHSA